MSDQMACAKAEGPDPYWPKGWYRFPLLPVFKYRPEDKHNRSSISFDWMALRAWSSMAPDIGFGITLTDMDLQIRVNIPYLHAGLFIPLFPQSWHQKLWRVKKYDFSKPGALQ